MSLSRKYIAVLERCYRHGQAGKDQQVIRDYLAAVRLLSLLNLR